MSVALTRSEEDHLKAVFHLEGSGESAFTTAIAERLNTKASSVTSMVLKLAEKGLLTHRPYRGVNLTRKGRALAVALVRKHRLWETFLVERLGFGWEEVHEVAEQLEHIHSIKLIDRLDAYLAHPSTDPHGEPIPDKEGRVKAREWKRLSELKSGSSGRVTAVNDRSAAFLDYLNRQRIGIGTRLRVVERNSHDGTLAVYTPDQRTVLFGSDSANNILIDA